MTTLFAAPRRRTLGPVRAPVREVRRQDGDEIVLARLRAGDDGGLASAYAIHGGVVHATARRVTASEHLANEVTQDVFVHLWERPDRVDLSRGSLRSYLCVIAQRRGIDAVRRTERRTRAEAVAGADGSTRTVGTDASEDVTDAAAARWCHERLVEALALLPDEQRTAVTMAYLEGRSLREVATLLGIPEGTAKSRVRLGLARVRNLVGDELMREMR